ncbi:Hypothetical predicted protein [Podarcis lilfordi]|uniref:Uncharacterized protein n=1 Tax=Podarcis lilfordi TaxID=74358 RepID=A0AA35JND2_9SAUR|nr:Hypothetical predicted protein [Podarcis lilfordi]
MARKQQSLLSPEEFDSRNLNSPQFEGRKNPKHAHQSALVVLDNSAEKWLLTRQKTRALWPSTK